MDPLLSGSESAATERGRAIIDAAEVLESVSMTVTFREGVFPGQIIEVMEASRTWRGMITAVQHSVQGPVVTTDLEVFRRVA